MIKLDKLNKIEVLDFDVDSGDLVYVNIEDSPENREVLIELGATMEEIEEMKNGLDELDELDISTFAIEKCGANYYQHGEGFLLH